MSNEKFFNFPVPLLEGFMLDSKKVLNDICNYAVYTHSLTLEHGNGLKRMIDSASFYKITLGNNKKALNNGKVLYDSIPYDSPRVGINISMWWDFYKNDKSDFDKSCLLGFLAIKSIIGNKAYCKVTNLYLWSRMEGKVNAVTDVMELSAGVRKYANEYQTNKIKLTLRKDWNLIHYSRYTRGFYVSFKLTLDQLVFEAEKRRKATKEKQFKSEEKEAIRKALERLNGTRP